MKIITIQELINKLKKFNPNRPVRIILTSPNIPVCYPIINDIYPDPDPDCLDVLIDSYYPSDYPNGKKCYHCGSEVNRIMARLCVKGKGFQPICEACMEKDAKILEDPEYWNREKDKNFSYGDKTIREEYKL